MHGWSDCQPTIPGCLGGGALPGDCYAVAVCIWFFVEITRPHIRITVEICDEPTIPAVDNARYEIHRFMSENATKIPPSLRQNFSVPGYVNVTYTCDQGYRLQDPNNNMIGCKYVTTPRKFSNGSIHETVVAEAVWKSAEGIICKYGEEAIKSKVHYVGVYIRKNLAAQTYGVLQKTSKKLLSSERMWPQPHEEAEPPKLWLESNLACL